MIYVKVELWPLGDKEKAKPLGELLIANDGTGTLTRGNYRAVIKNSVGRLTRRGEVKDFPRKRLNVFDLMYRMLKVMVGERNEKTGKRKGQK